MHSSAITQLPDWALRAGGVHAPIKCVVAVATVHQFAVVTMWEVEISREHVAGIGCTVVMAIARLTVTLPRGAVAAGTTVLRVLDEAAATS